jgi:NAD(P)H-hydrate repair Nnr-like enzyme with NAD(P)H-hydrate epimerase domain
MPKSKKRKNHSQKINARRQKIENEKKSLKKEQQRMLERLIQQEQSSGMFNDNKVVGDDLIIDGIVGPSI